MDKKSVSMKGERLPQVAAGEAGEAGDEAVCLSAGYLKTEGQGIIGCEHGCQRDMCFLCLLLMAPPAKRYCRSLSMPSDVKATRNSCSHSYLREGHSSSRSLLQGHSSSRSLLRPIAIHPYANSSKFLRGSQATPSASQRLRFGGFYPLTTRVSVDSTGHGGLQGSSLSTPSDSPSPVPRPSSASSGFFGSSYSSLSISLCEGGGALSRVGIHKGGGVAFRKGAVSLSAEGILEVGLRGEDGVSRSIARGSASTSPANPRPLRCRSQPSVLQPETRRGAAKKRRHDREDRPTLDFLKMKETAYDRPRSRMYCASGATNKNRNHVQFAEDFHQYSDDTNHSPAGAAEVFPMFGCGLDTIESSPLESTKHHQPSVLITTEFDHLGSCERFRDCDSPSLGPSSALTFTDACSDSYATSENGSSVLDSSENSCSCDESYFQTVCRRAKVADLEKEEGRQNEEEREIVGEKEDGGESEKENSGKCFRFQINSDLDIDQIEMD